MYLRDLRLGYLVCIDSTQPSILFVNLKHDAFSLFVTFVKDLYKYIDHKVHRRIVVVEQKDLVLFGKSEIEILIQFQIMLRRHYRAPKKSSIISSGFSNPTETRISPSVIPKNSRSSLAKSL